MAVVCTLCGWSKEIPSDFTHWRELNVRAEFYPITSNGDPDGEMNGFICARCLRNANKMRIQIKASLSGLRITNHAYDRFRQRLEGERMNDDSIRQAIIKIFNNSRQIRFKDYFMERRLLNNNNIPADYWYHSGWILVTTKNDPRTVMTIERSWGRKLGVDFRYLEADEPVHFGRISGNPSALSFARQ